MIQDKKNDSHLFVDDWRSVRFVEPVSSLVIDEVNIVTLKRKKMSDRSGPQGNYFEKELSTKFKLYITQTSLDEEDGDEEDGEENIRDGYWK